MFGALGRPYMVLWITVGSLSVSSNNELLKRWTTIGTKWLKCKPSLLQTLTPGNTGLAPSAQSRPATRGRGANSSRGRGQNRGRGRGRGREEEEEMFYMFRPDNTSDHMQQGLMTLHRGTLKPVSKKLKSN